MDAETTKAAGDILAAAADLLQRAAAAGIVLTIEQVPLQPLAMGHYATVASVRDARRTT